MRDQLNELMDLAKQVRSAIQINHVEDQSVHVSTWIKARRSDTTYYAVSFLQGSKKLEVSLFQDKDYNSNNISIDIENINDDELEEIILRSKQDIITFIADLDNTRNKRRLKKIEELKNQLQELQTDVSTSEVNL